MCRLRVRYQTIFPIFKISFVIEWPIWTIRKKKGGSTGRACRTFIQHFVRYTWSLSNCFLDQMRFFQHSHVVNVTIAVLLLFVCPRKMFCLYIPISNDFCHTPIICVLSMKMNICHTRQSGGTNVFGNRFGNVP